MRTLQFNFNNEVDTFEIHQDEETGRIRVPGMTGSMSEYESIEQFAEMFAIARDVLPEHLKNWTLLENGDVVSYVLRAGMAGVSAEDIADQVNAVFQELSTSGEFHPLDVERVRQEVQNADDIMRALAGSSVMEVARRVYDRLNEQGAFNVPEPEPEEVDERSEVEKYLDRVMEQDKSLAFFANLLVQDRGASKDEILAALENSSVPFTVEMLRNLYERALDEAMSGINVSNRFEAIMVVSQMVPGLPSEDAKAKIITTANIARREKVNMTAYTVGRHHIHKVGKLATTMELNDMDVYLFGNVPVVVAFDPEIDARMEAEREGVAEEDAEDLTEWEDDEDDYDYDDYDDSYDED